MASRWDNLAPVGRRIKKIRISARENPHGLLASLVSKQKDSSKFYTPPSPTSRSVFPTSSTFNTLKPYPRRRLVPPWRTIAPCSGRSPSSTHHGNHTPAAQTATRATRRGRRVGTYPSPNKTSAVTATAEAIHYPKKTGKMQSEKTKHLKILAAVRLILILLRS